MHLSLLTYLYKAQGQVMPQLTTPIRLENVNVKIVVMKNMKA
jgi:hypothetical protein